MLKIENNQLTLWNALLPEPLRKLPEELAMVDELLDNPAFLKPFIERISRAVGDRPFRPRPTCASCISNTDITWATKHSCKK